MFRVFFIHGEKGKVKMELDCKKIAYFYFLLEHIVVNSDLELHTGAKIPQVHRL